MQKDRKSKLAGYGESDRASQSVIIELCKVPGSNPIKDPTSLRDIGNFRTNACKTQVLTSGE